MKRLLLLFIVFASLPAMSEASVFPIPETRGVWAPAGYSPYDSASVDTMIRNLSAANFNVIYLGVWDGHTSDAGTIYPSRVVNEAGGPLQYPEFVGTDPLRTYIDIAHKYGMQVIAWFELMPLSVSVSKDSTDEPLLLKANPGWAMVQRDTAKVGYCHLGYGYYFAMDPAVPAVADFVTKLYTECARNYPGLAGIESDIEDDTTLSYSQVARSRFMRETGEPDPLKLPPNDSAWLAWRRLQVTQIADRIYKGIKKVNPSCVVTAAVEPPAWGLKKYLAHWNVWAQKGYVDMVETMDYEPRKYFDKELKESLNFVPAGFPLLAGIDATGNSMKDVITDIRDSRAFGSAGEVIWYYRPISSAAALMKLKSSVFRSKTLPSFDDLVLDSQSRAGFRKTGVWSRHAGGFRGGYLSGRAAESDTAVFSTRILRGGFYSEYGYWSGNSATNCSRVVVRTTAGSLFRQNLINEKSNLNSWNYLGGFHLNSGDTVKIRLYGKGGGHLIADAFRFRRRGSCAPDQRSGDRQRK